MTQQRQVPGIKSAVRRAGDVAFEFQGRGAGFQKDATAGELGSAVRAVAATGSDDEITVEFERYEGEAVLMEGVEDDERRLGLDVGNAGAALALDDGASGGGGQALGEGEGGDSGGLTAGVGDTSGGLATRGVGGWHSGEGFGVPDLDGSGAGMGFPVGVPGYVGA